MSRLAETLAGPWTDQDQCRLDSFLTETSPMKLTTAMRNALDYIDHGRGRPTTAAEKWIYGHRPITKATIRALARRGLVVLSDHEVCGVMMPHCAITAEGKATQRRLRLLDSCRRDGPDSDEALAAVADGETLEERDLLEAIRLGAGAQYDSKGQGQLR